MLASFRRTLRWLGICGLVLAAASIAATAPAERIGAQGGVAVRFSGQLTLGGSGAPAGLTIAAYQFIRRSYADIVACGTATTGAGGLYTLDVPAKAGCAASRQDPIPCCGFIFVAGGEQVGFRSGGSVTARLDSPVRLGLQQPNTNLRGTRVPGFPVGDSPADGAVMFAHRVWGRLTLAGENAPPGTAISVRQVLRRSAADAVDCGQGVVGSEPGVYRLDVPARGGCANSETDPVPCCDFRFSVNGEEVGRASGGSVSGDLANPESLGGVTQVSLRGTLPPMTACAGGTALQGGVCVNVPADAPPSGDPSATPLPSPCPPIGDETGVARLGGAGDGGVPVSFYQGVEPTICDVTIHIVVGVSEKICLPSTVRNLQGTALSCVGDRPTGTGPQILAQIAIHGTAMFCIAEIRDAAGRIIHNARILQQNLAADRQICLQREAAAEPEEEDFCLGPRGERRWTPGPYSHMADEPRSTRARADFTETQKRKVVSENWHLSGNRTTAAPAGHPGGVYWVLESDGFDRSTILWDPNGGYMGRGRTVDPNDDAAPQIDHICPRAIGGPNQYANACLLTRKENLQKTDRPPYACPRTAFGPSPYLAVLTEGQAIDGTTPSDGAAGGVDGVAAQAAVCRAPEGTGAAISAVPSAEGGCLVGQEHGFRLWLPGGWLPATLEAGSLPVFAYDAPDGEASLTLWRAAEGEDANGLVQELVARVLDEAPGMVVLGNDGYAWAAAVSGADSGTGAALSIGGRETADVGVVVLAASRGGETYGITLSATARYMEERKEAFARLADSFHFVP